MLDVSVLDKDRRPVRGLRAADFTLLENGQPQKVSSFGAVDFEDPVLPTSPAPWTRDVAPDVQKNTDVNDKRLVVIVMDDAVPIASCRGSASRELESVRDAVNDRGRPIAAVGYPLVTREAGIWWT